VLFAPTTAGPRYGAAEIFDAAGKILATAFFQGTGVAPQAVIYPGTRTAPFTSATAGLASATALAADGRGNLYIVDAANNQVIKETRSGNYMPSIVANSRFGGLANPQGTAVDGAGSVYIADTGNNRVVKATFIPASNDLSRGVFSLTTLHTSSLSAPHGVAVDGAGNVYIADTGNNRVLKLTLAKGEYTETAIGSGFHRPSGLAVDGAGNVYIADTGDSQVWVEKLAAGAYTPALIGSGLDQPRGLAVDAAGNVYIADTGSNRLLLESRQGELFTQSEVARELGAPTGVALNGEGNLFIAESGSRRVTELKVAEQQSVKFAPAGESDTETAKILTLVNIGNAPLLFPAPAAGKNPFFAIEGSSAQSAYVLKSDSSEDCQQLTASSPEAASLQAGSTCLLHVTVAPRAVRGAANQAASHVLTLTDNSLNAARAQQAVKIECTVCGGTAATLTSPATSAGVGVSPLGTSPVTFTWSAGSGVTYYDLYIGTTVPGSYDILNLQHTTDVSSAPITFPSQGLTVYVRLSSKIGGSWTDEDYTFAESPAAAAVLAAPTSGVLPRPPATKTFTWSAGTGVTYYDLLVGTTAPGSWDLANIQHTSATNSGPITIPSQGLTVYVRLMSKIAQVWTTYDYTFTEAAPQKADMISPLNGASLLSPPNSQTFTWTPGIGVTLYDLYLGTTGPGSWNLYYGDHLATTSTTVSIPAGPGTPIYARLQSKIGGAWYHTDYIYYTSQAGHLTSPATVAGVGVAKLPASPATVDFTWTAGHGVMFYDLYASTVAPGGYDLYRIEHTSSLDSGPLTFLPQGQTVYIRLGSDIANTWTWYDYTFTEAPSAAAVLTSPVTSGGVGGVLPTSQTFTWSTGTGVTYYDLLVGTTAPGSFDLANIQHTAATSSGAITIPANGLTVYVRLSSKIGGSWTNNDYTFTESPAAAAVLLTPTSSGGVGGVLTNPQTFTWSAGTGATYYDLLVGTGGVGHYELANIQHTNSLTSGPIAIPTGGHTIYVRLSTKIAGTWTNYDYTFTEP